MAEKTYDQMSYSEMEKQAAILLLKSIQSVADRITERKAKEKEYEFLPLAIRELLRLVRE